MRQVTIENISFFFVLFFLHIVVEMEIGDIYILLFSLSSISVSLLLLFYILRTYLSFYFLLFISCYVMVREIKIEKVWKIPK